MCDALMCRQLDDLQRKIYMMRERERERAMSKKKKKTQNKWLYEKHTEPSVKQGISVRFYDTIFSLLYVELTDYVIYGMNERDWTIAKFSILIFYF